MKPGDRELGMDRPITRRDFLHGMSVAVAGGLAARRASGEPAPRGESRVESRGGPRGEPAPTTPGSYPPALSGLRGSQPGSFEVAHELAREGRSDWAPVDEPDDATYDLVVVGGGISGLAAAYFFRRRNPDARILILENHDDFGGHARRNEFRSGGRTLIGYGGSQSLEEPSSYSSVAKTLLRELGVETSRFYTAYDEEFYRTHGLGEGVYFDRVTYGVDRLVPIDLASAYPGGTLAAARLPQGEAVQQMPISEAAKRELMRLFELDSDRLPDMSIFGEPSFLKKISYQDFLAEYLGIRDSEVRRLLHCLTAGLLGLGIDSISAWDGIWYGSLPGLRGTSLGRFEGLIERLYGISSEPYIFHFPDGNASIARLLVRSLIPEVASGKTMEDVVTAHFEYRRLDEIDSQVRLRLESTVVRVEHDGPPAVAKRVAVTYVRAGRTQRVWSKACVLACYNTMIPHLCPELPAEQREGLASMARAPLIYSNVLLRNWQPWKKAGLAVAFCPGSYHQAAMLDYPVSLGDYRFSGGPEDPIVAHLERAPIVPGAGLAPREQYRIGRHELLAMPFDAIERSLRTQLAGMLGEAGFDPVLDIQAITVNRWPHGYAREYLSQLDPDYAEEEYPHVKGRRPFGRITIANSDSGASAYLDSAIDQAHRAVEELPS
jgi:spermidine dehydrogenase